MLPTQKRGFVKPDSVPISRLDKSPEKARAAYMIGVGALRSATSSKLKTAKSTKQKSVVATSNASNTSTQIQKSQQQPTYLGEYQIYDDSKMNCSLGLLGNTDISVIQLTEDPEYNSVFDQTAPFSMSRVAGSLLPLDNQRVQNHQIPSKILEQNQDDVAANASKTIYGISCISEKTAEIEIPCKIHNSKHIEAFCEVCWHPVCIQCILTNIHKGHEMLTIEEAIKKQRDITADTFFNKVMPLREKLFLWSIEAHEAAKSLQTQQNLSQQILKQNFAQVRQLLEIIESQILSNLNEKFSQKVDQATNTAMEIDKILSQTIKTINEHYKVPYETSMEILNSSRFITYQSLLKNSQPLVQQMEKCQKSSMQHGIVTPDHQKITEVLQQRLAEFKQDLEEESNLKIKQVVKIMQNKNRLSKSPEIKAELKPGAENVSLTKRQKGLPKMQMFKVAHSSKPVILTQKKASQAFKSPQRSTSLQNLDLDIVQSNLMTTSKKPKERKHWDRTCISTERFVYDSSVNQQSSDIVQLK